MSEIQLSIVVPVYNGEKFIKHSLQLLLDQATNDIEVIVVDDGSTDGTATIINDNFQAQLAANLLVFIRQVNQGVSVARNCGIAKASGQYIGFVDADDIVQPNYIETLLKGIESGADIIEFGFKTFASNVEELADNPSMYSNNRFGILNASEVLRNVSAIARWYPWTRIFKAELFEGIKFPPGVRFCEDLMTIPFLYAKAKSVLSLREILYGYRLNLASATFNVRPDYVKNLQEFYATIPKVGLIWHDYLRMSVAYAVHSCLLKSDKYAAVPKEIQSDLRSLRYRLTVYEDIEPRRIFLLLYPSLFKAFKVVKSILRGN